jgi:hypothetical protein
VLGIGRGIQGSDAGSDQGSEGLAAEAEGKSALFETVLEIGAAL